jgi:hypothetical protein
MLKIGFLEKSAYHDIKAVLLAAAAAAAVAVFLGYLDDVIQVKPVICLEEE